MLENVYVQHNWLRKAQLSADAHSQCFSIIEGNRFFIGGHWDMSSGAFGKFNFVKQN